LKCYGPRSMSVTGASLANAADDLFFWSPVASFSTGATFTVLQPREILDGPQDDVAQDNECLVSIGYLPVDPLNNSKAWIVTSRAQ
jgi:hypothetical protein